VALHSGCSSETLQSELFAKTVVALMLGDDADRLLDVQRAEHLARSWADFSVGQPSEW
jgi:hypothetical protein